VFNHLMFWLWYLAGGKETISSRSMIPKSL
jgi:hypothetical protein